MTAWYIPGVMRSLPTLAVITLVGVACGTDGLVSDPELEPPAGTEAYDPSDGMGEGGGGYYTTTGQVSAGGSPSGADDADGDGSSGGSSGAAAECAEADRLCVQTFELVDQGYGTVEVMGSFAEDGWNNGASMSLEDTTWRVTVDVSWAEDTEYRFRIDGGADWILDPENSDTENDNSVVRAAMFADFFC